MRRCRRERWQPERGLTVEIGDLEDWRKAAERRLVDISGREEETLWSRRLAVLHFFRDSKLEDDDQ